jgi:hypothetical protein
MIFLLSGTIVCISSYYVMNMIHAIYIWVLMILIMDVFIGCENRLKTKMDTSTLWYQSSLWIENWDYWLSFITFLMLIFKILFWTIGKYTSSKVWACFYMYGSFTYVLVIFMDAIWPLIHLCVQVDTIQMTTPKLPSYGPQYFQGQMRHEYSD